MKTFLTPQPTATKSTMSDDTRPTPEPTPIDMRTFVQGLRLLKRNGEYVWYSPQIHAEGVFPHLTSDGDTYTNSGRYYEGCKGSDDIVAIATELEGTNGPA